MAKKIKRKSEGKEKAERVNDDAVEGSDAESPTEGGDAGEGPSLKPKKPSLLNHFEMKIDKEDKWELWSIAAVTLAVITLILLVISMLQLGKWSVIAWVEGLLYCGFATIIIGFIGMLRVLFRPPPIRKTRTIAFVCLLVVGLLGLAQPRLFGIPQSTDNWVSDVPIKLPFNGTWTTIQGDDDKNYLKEMKMPPLKWSYVFTSQVDKKIHKNVTGEPKNVDYYCWDQPVLAPVAGEIIDFSTSNSDIEMGGSAQSNKTSPLGNFVAIKFGENEFLFVSGMRQDSITVQPGDHVELGQQIGRCGRSGYAMFPSVVVHGQNSINFPFSEGLPIKFSDIVIDGAKVAQGQPQGMEYLVDTDLSTGQLVSNGTDGSGAPSEP